MYGMYGYNGFGQEEPAPVTPGEQAGSQIDQAAATLLQLVMNGPGSSEENQRAAAESLATLDPGTRQQVCASMSTLAAQQSDATVQQRVNAVCTMANQPGGPGATPTTPTPHPTNWMLIGGIAVVVGVGAWLLWPKS
jgi:hypothetical protein